MLTQNALVKAQRNHKIKSVIPCNADVEHIQEWAEKTYAHPLKCQMLGDVQKEIPRSDISLPHSH